MTAPHTPMAITAFGDPVLDLPPRLDERQQALARTALQNIPPPPRTLPPRLVVSEAMQVPFVGSIIALVPALVQRLRRDAVMGPRGIGAVTDIQLARDMQGNSRNFFWVQFEYLLDGQVHRAATRAAEGDAADARNARIVPIVVDPTRPERVIVWWSALDVR